MNDHVLAAHYGLTAEELDHRWSGTGFIPSTSLRASINYDTRLRRGFGGQVKYRLGSDAGGESE